MTKKEEAIKELRELLKPLDYIYTILRSMSASGMNRVIDCYIIEKDNKPLWIGGRVAEILDYKWNEKKGGIKVNVWYGYGVSSCLRTWSYLVPKWRRQNDNWTKWKQKT